VIARVLMSSPQRAYSGDAPVLKARPYHLEIQGCLPKLVL
jgi:hypothetical protein